MKSKEIKNALKIGDWRAIENAVDNGADPNYLDEQHDDYPLIMAAADASEYDFVIKLIDKYNVDPFCFADYGDFTETLFESATWAALLGERKLFDKIMSFDPSQELLGRAFLMAATYDSDGNIIKALIEKGVDVNYQDKDGLSAFHHFFLHSLNDENFEFKAEHAVKNLIKIGADINIKNKKGETPFHYAMTWAHCGIETSMRMFLRANPDMEIPNNKKITPYTTAVKSDYLDGIVTLINNKRKQKEEIDNGKKIDKGLLNNILDELEYAMFIDDIDQFKKLFNSLTDKNEILNNVKWINKSCDDQSMKINEFLIENGCHLSKNDGDDANISIKITKNGWVGSAKKLIERGINYNKKNQKSTY